MARNKVIAGDYEGYSVKVGWSDFIFKPPLFSQNNSINLSKHTVRSYQIITGEHRKSAVSGIARGLIGGYFFGNAGMIGGTLSAKNRGEYTISVTFYDGRRSLIEVDEKKIQSIN